MSAYLAKPQRFLIRPAPGWVDLTCSEAKSILGSPLQAYKFAPIATIEDGVVVVSACDYRQALELVTRLTTAHDLEWVIHSGRVNSRADWPTFLEKSGVGGVFPDSAFHVSVSVTHPVVGTAKDVKKIAVQMWGLNTDSDREDADGDDAETERPINRRVRIDSAKNRTRVLVSMGGEPLYKRGYKARNVFATAPLPEHHASACFLWCADTLKFPLADGLRNGSTVIAAPFAGTGTPGFEAICRSADFAPGLSRMHYACEDFSFHPVATLKTIRSRLTTRVKDATHARVIFGDLNENVCDALEAQRQAFFDATKLSPRIDILLNDFLANPVALVEGRVDSTTRLFLPLNPPYGLRLASKTGAGSIYERLGRALTFLAGEYLIAGYVICPDEESWEILLRQCRALQCKSRHFTHGGADTRLVAFESKAIERR